MAKNTTTRPGARHILIVEDNPAGRETLRTLLQMLGHRVDVAADGLEGVYMALACRPEIAVVDIGLPLLDGYEVARELRRAFGRGIFLIAHTAYDEPEDRQRVQEAGFDVHLVKPVDLKELFRYLERPAGQREVSEPRPGDTSMLCGAATGHGDCRRHEANQPDGAAGRLAKKA